MPWLATDASVQQEAWQHPEYGVVVRLRSSAAGCRVKLEDRLATVTSAREAADSTAMARELDCERHLDHLDGALQVCRPTPIAAMQCVHLRCKILEWSSVSYTGKFMRSFH